MTNIARKRARYDEDFVEDSSAHFDGNDADDYEAPSASASRPNQILPVADLPADFDGIPLDGSQYLAVVRRQAQRAPMIVRVDNPYAVDASAGASQVVATPGELPSTEWRTTFLTRLRNMREALGNRPKADGGADVGMPKAKDAQKWLAFVRGAGNSSSEKSKSREPSSTLLARLQTQQIMYLLQVLRDAISDEAEENSNNAEPGASGGALDSLYAKWLFALLAHLDDRLVADDISTLRTLARACIESIAEQRRRRRLLLSKAQSSAAQPADIQAELGAWIVVCAVAGIWSQHDLWDDAGTTLAVPVRAV